MNFKKSIVKIVKFFENTTNISLVENIAKNVLNNKFATILNIISLKIDKKNKRITIVLTFYKENEKITVCIQKYNISKDNDYFIIRKISTDKEWILNLFKKFIQDKPFAIPTKLSVYMEFLK